jgi:membrane protein YqaA with SNARE-associated domain
MRWTRRLYAWVLSWADRPGGSLALFWLAFAESSFFPIPPDVLLLALGFGAPRRSWRFAAICSAGSVLGGIFGYFLGYAFMDALGMPLLQFYGAVENFERIGDWYRAYDAWAVGIAGFTPIPYKVFTLAAGAFQINFAVFVLASLASRSARFFLIAGVLRFFGARSRDFLEKHLDWAILGFTVLLLGGFVLIRYAKW